MKKEKMMEKPIRILNIVGIMDPGGIETLIMNIYRNIDRSKVQFDFLTHKGTDGVFDDEIRKMGGRIYKMPKLRDREKTYYWKLLEYRRELIRFFKEHQEYHVIHGHMTNTAAIYMPIAKKYGSVNCCISHSHLTQARPGLSGKITDILHKKIPKLATDYFACSEMAANWIYPKSLIEQGKVRIIKNGVDPLKFDYDLDKAIQVREKLHLENKYVIGNVARFKTEKNHEFQIDIFNEVHKSIPNSVLMLIGEGELMKNIKEKVNVLGIEDSVIFMGVRQDVSDLMQAMDIFILPSLWEGLPVVGVEAQAAGLPVVMSTGVTRETDITGNVTFLDLSSGAHAWADEIVRIQDTYKRKSMMEYIRKNGYDITVTAKWLQNFYIAKHNNSEMGK